MSTILDGEAKHKAPMIGVIGVGAMGGAMARTLLKAHYPVTVCDVDGARTRACQEAGAAVAASACEIVERCGVIMTSLPSSAVFVKVAEESLLPNARGGQLFLDMGTTAATETRRLAALFKRKTAALLDTPVSGGPQGAATGALRVFAGGDRAAFDRARPILEVLGEPERVVYCGASGSGQIVKGVNQLAMGLGAAACLEAIAFGVRAGVDIEPIRQAVGGPESWRGHFGAIAGQVIAGKARSVYVKLPELPYFLGEAREQGFDIPLTRALFGFLDSAPHSSRDNMGRPTVPFWDELMNRMA